MKRVTMTRNPAETLFLAAVLAALAGIYLAMMPPGLSSNEEAVQYVQMKNLVTRGSLEIDSPAIGLGFGAEDVAGARGLFESRGGRLHAVAPPIFPWVAGLFYPLAGEGAVDFTPVLFLFLSALVLGLVLDRLMRRDLTYWLLLAVFLVGSPVFLQGMHFSGMTLALFLIVSALGLLVSHFQDRPATARLFGASVLMGASVLVRPECLLVVLSFYLCAAMVLAAHGRMKDLRTILAGFVASTAMLVLHDLALHGTFPGPYLQMFLPFYALSPIRVAVLGGSLAVSFALIVLSLREGIAPVRKAILPILSLVLVFGAVLLTAARFTVTHLMAVFPAVLFVFHGVPRRIEELQKRKGGLEGILAGTTILCLILGAAILRPGKWVVLTAWVPMIPPVVVLIAANRKAVFAAEGVSLVLAFFIGVALVNGIQESREGVLKYRAYNAARVDFIGKHTAAGDAVLFSDIGSMEHAGPLFFDRVFLLAKGPGDAQRLAGRLAGRGVERIYAWTRDPHGLGGGNPYGEKWPPAFPPPPGSGPCCGASCRQGNDYLVRIDTRQGTAAGIQQGGLPS
jgi:hypothetical protein